LVHLPEAPARRDPRVPPLRVQGHQEGVGPRRAPSRSLHLRKASICSRILLTAAVSLALPWTKFRWPLSPWAEKGPSPHSGQRLSLTRL
jgi:hypothetical protein